MARSTASLRRASIFVAAIIVAVSLFSGVEFAFADSIVDYSDNVCYTTSSYFRSSTTLLAARPSYEGAATVLYQTPSATSEFIIRCLSVWQSQPLNADGKPDNNPFWPSCAPLQSPFRVCASKEDVFKNYRQGTWDTPTRYTFNTSSIPSVCTEYNDLPYSSGALATKAFGYPGAPQLFYRVELHNYKMTSPNCYPLWINFVAMLSMGEAKTRGEPMVWIIVACIIIFVVLLIVVVVGLYCFSDWFRALLGLRPRNKHTAKLARHHDALSHIGGEYSPHRRSGSVDSAIYAGQAMEDVPPGYENVHRGMSIENNFSPSRHVPHAAYPHNHHDGGGGGGSAVRGQSYGNPSAEKRIDYGDDEDTDARNASAVMLSPNGNGRGPSSAGNGSMASNLSRHVQLGPAIAGGDEYSPVWSVGRRVGSPNMTRLDDEASFHQGEPAFYSNMVGRSVAVPDFSSPMPNPQQGSYRPQPALPRSSQSPEALGDYGGNRGTPQPPSGSRNRPPQGQGGDSNNATPSLYDASIAAEIYGGANGGASSARRKVQYGSPQQREGSGPPLRSPWLDVVADTEAGAGGTIALAIADDDDDDAPSPFRSTVGLAGGGAQRLLAGASPQQQDAPPAVMTRGGGLTMGSFGGGELRRRNNQSIGGSPIVPNFGSASPITPHHYAKNGHTVGVVGGGGSASKGTSPPMFDEEYSNASPERLAASRYVPGGHVPPPNFGGFGSASPLHTQQQQPHATPNAERSRQFIPPPPLPYASASPPRAGAGGPNTSRRHISFHEDNPSPVGAPPFEARGAGYFNPMNAYGGDEGSGSASPPRAGASSSPPNNNYGGGGGGYFDPYGPAAGGQSHGGGAAPAGRYTINSSLGGGAGDSLSPPRGDYGFGGGAVNRPFAGPLQHLNFGNGGGDSTAHHSYVDPYSGGAGGGVTSDDFDRL